jgi:hypothetical protein
MVRTVSETGFDRTRRSTFGFSHIDSTDDMCVPIGTGTNNVTFSFVSCNEPGCTITSAFGVWNAMTLRCGFPTCTMHTITEVVRNRTTYMEVPTKPVVIFYDVEVTASREIEQVSATVGGNERHFDTYIRITVRRHNSPIISRIPTMLYMMTVMDPRTAMEHFINWVRNVSVEVGGSSVRDEDVIMVAHSGSKHDHVLTIKTMMKWGINPPAWRFSDTLPLFKVVVSPNERASLVDLVDMYVPWFNHTPHDALSDAEALMNVVMTAVPDWTTACYAFSNTYESFATSVGLDTFRVRNPIPFPSTMINTMNKGMNFGESESEEAREVTTVGSDRIDEVLSVMRSVVMTMESVDRRLTAIETTVNGMSRGMNVPITRTITAVPDPNALRISNTPTFRSGVTNECTSETGP